MSLAVKLELKLVLEPTIVVLPVLAVPNPGSTVTVGVYLNVYSYSLISFSSKDALNRVDEVT